MYKPISCNYYDELTLFAMRGTGVVILYKNENGEELKMEAVIKDIVTRQKEEFLILSNTQEIRLDQLISVNGKKVSDYC